MVGNGVVVPGGNVVMEVREVGSVHSSEDEREVTISIIDTIQFFSFQKLLDVVFHNR